MPRESRGTVTLADVARAAGVSLATASFVLSGRGGSRSAGSAETKKKVRAAAAELGYVPNRHAQAMRTGRGGGVVLGKERGVGWAGARLGFGPVGRRAVFF